MDYFVGFLLGYFINKIWRMLKRFNEIDIENIEFLQWGNDPYGD